MNHNELLKGMTIQESEIHAIFDICTDMSADMSHGERGFYPKGFEPVRPHPQCMCVPIPAYQDPEQFTERLIGYARCHLATSLI